MVIHVKWVHIPLQYLQETNCDNPSLAIYISVPDSGSVPVRVPVGVQKRCWDVVLQLDDSEPQCAHGEHPGAIN